ncbi:hypothetical protein P9D43_21750 [Neobacillus niacini]|uniref:hypothetical protein n=1 Tax=Neobacillus niacini TaxID=86668 RepID=UPI0007ABA146|nr:hypothetical protein [Neobacillus niacini]MEC1524633.1 hypothetical protein [Neobacillus niacini]
MLLHSWEGQGEVLGLRLTINRASQFSAPFVFGGIGTATGVGSLFFFIGTIIFTGTFFTRIKEDKEAASDSFNKAKIKLA